MPVEAEPGLDYQRGERAQACGHEATQRIALGLGCGSGVNGEGRHPSGHDVIIAAGKRVVVIGRTRFCLEAGAQEGAFAQQNGPVVAHGDDLERASIAQRKGKPIE